MKKPQITQIAVANLRNLRNLRLDLFIKEILMRKLNRGVAVVGTGMSQFGSFPEKTTRDLFVEAFQDMRASVDRGLDPNDIEALYVGNYSSDLFEG